MKSLTRFLQGGTIRNHCILAMQKPHQRLKSFLLSHYKSLTVSLKSCLGKSYIYNIYWRSSHFPATAKS